MVILALLTGLTVFAAVFVVGTMLLLGAHWFSVRIAKSLEKLIDTVT